MLVSRRAATAALRRMPPSYKRAVARHLSTETTSPAPSLQSEPTPTEKAVNYGSQTPAKIAKPGTPVTVKYAPAVSNGKKTSTAPSFRSSHEKSPSLASQNRSMPTNLQQTEAPMHISRSPAPALLPSTRHSSSPSSVWSSNFGDGSRSRYDSQPDAYHAIEARSIDWSTSYHGISAKPVSEEQCKQLKQAADVKDIEVKPDGVIYLPEIKYRRKLNEVFGPMGWGLVPRSEPSVGEHIVTREYALIVNGRFVSQAQGENNFFSVEQLPSAVEGCKSNALMRCCKDLGIGSELWDPVFIRWFKKNYLEEVWVEHVATKKKKIQWYRRGSVEVLYPYKRSSSTFSAIPPKPTA